MARRPKPRTYAGAVKLREKILSNGHRSLHLDIFQQGKRTYEFRKLYLTGTKEHDAETLRIAGTIRAQWEIELQASDHDLVPAHLRKANFVEFFDGLTGKRHSSSRGLAVRQGVHRRHAGVRPDHRGEAGGLQTIPPRTPEQQFGAALLRQGAGRIARGRAAGQSAIESMRGGAGAGPRTQDDRLPYAR
ncbi:MAG TPA: Arm DNA-binding domain-containing protein [Candidatus Kapabacteria bacterium]|nr:Arm DNA-binding domain-containing protein [Candidatus Kapabacteria bacterium]